MWVAGCWGDFNDTEYFTSLLSKPKCVQGTVLWHIAPPTPQSKAGLEEVVIGSRMGPKGKESGKHRLLTTVPTEACPEKHALAKTLANTLHQRSPLANTLHQRAPLGAEGLRPNHLCSVVWSQLTAEGLRSKERLPSKWVMLIVLTWKRGACPHLEARGCLHRLTASSVHDSLSGQQAGRCPSAASAAFHWGPVPPPRIWLTCVTHLGSATRHLFVLPLPHSPCSSLLVFGLLLGLHVSFLDWKWAPFSLTLFSLSLGNVSPAVAAGTVSMPGLQLVEKKVPPTGES